MVNGLPINFAFQGTNGITINGLAGKLELQSAEVTAKAENEVVRLANGDKMARGWYDQHQQANLEFIITGSGLADAIAQSTVNNYKPGAFITVTTCTSVPDLVGKAWEVMDGGKIAGSNTTAKKLTLPLEYNPNIQATAAP
jgi:hypothetical protein